MEKTKKIALLGLLLAMITVLSYIEHSVPPIPLLPPNIRLGLSNIVTMFCVYYIGYKEAIILAVLKSAFVLLTRGMTAGILSFSGGMLSLIVLIILLLIFKDKLSYILASILSAIAHNLGQLVAVSILMQENLFLFYLPVLLVFGVLVGFVTGTVLRIILPLLKKYFRY